MTQPISPLTKVAATTIADALLRQNWVYAKTQPQNPHEYCLREGWSADYPFEDAVLHIRQNGFGQVFDGQPYTYFYIDGYQYWTMGSPVCDTTPHK